MAGDAKNPIEIDTYENLYKSLDAEFYSILDLYRWIKTGLYTPNINEIPYSWALSIRYLIEYNDYLERQQRIF